MSQLNKPDQVLFFCSVLFNPKIWDDKKIEDLFFHFDFVIQDILRPSENPLIDYYSNEMGDELDRAIYIFKNIGSRDQLVNFKLLTTQLENQSLLEGKRSINLDCGYISKENLVLATGKPYSHRVHLKDGVYAELTYTFQNKTYQGLPWTYPDYLSPEKIDFFNSNRSSLLSV